MSRSYAMSVEITGVEVARREQVVAACCEEWSFSPEVFDNDPPSEGDGPSFVLFGEGALCGGEMEEEFADRLAGAVWKANAGHCQVIVRATCMEALPYETYIRHDEADFRVRSDRPPLSS